MASKSKQRKCKNSMHINGYMKDDGRAKHIGIYQKRHRQQAKRQTAKEYADMLFG